MERFLARFRRDLEGGILQGAPNSQRFGLYRQTSLPYGNFAAQLRGKAEAREVFIDER